MLGPFGQEALRKEKLLRLSSSEAEESGNVSGEVQRRRRRHDDDDDVDDVDSPMKFSLVPSDSSNLFVFSEVAVVYHRI